MTRSMFWVLTAGLLGSALNHAAAEPSPIATSMGDLRWGLSESEVTSFAKRKLADQYNGEISKTKDSGKQGKLRGELKQAQADVGKSVVNFSGGHSKWDNSPIAGEFTYGNRESMLMSKAPNAQDFYFFVDGRLWKWCEVLDKAAVGGGDFKKFSQAVEGKFGKGRVKKGEITPGHGNTQWLEYLDRNSRLRAADNDSKRNGYALIYEEMATVRQLASTRPAKPTRLAGAADDDASEIKSSTPKQQKAGSEDGQIAKGPSKRSMFASDNQNESEADYESRKQKTAVETRDRQQRAHERKEDAKKGEALKQLDGLNDSDPLGGL